MKTRNWKLCILAIFLVVCFTVYAGNCYSQTYEPFGLLDTLGSQMFSTGLPDYYFPYDPIPSPYPYEPYRFVDYGWGGSGTLKPIWGWRHPGGQSTIELLQKRMPMLNINYREFFGMEPEPVWDIIGYERHGGYPPWDPYPWPGPYPGPFPDPYPISIYDDFGFSNPVSDFSGYKGPITQEMNPYLRSDLYVRPKAGEQTLYHLTKNSPVQMMQPDLLTPYGASYNMGMGNMGRMGDFGY
jgi:hypothetical protein